MDNIHLIFPTTILVDSIDREFTNDEILSYLNADYESDHFSISTNSVQFTRSLNIIKEHNLKDLHDFILKKAYDYLSAYEIKDKINLTIIRSWFVKSQPLSYGRKHNHPNSLLSGVLYLKTPPNSGNLILHDSATSKFGSIELSFNNINNVNGAQISIPPKEGMLIIFPSTLDHEISQNTCTEDRYSLSFDIWMNGNIGSSNTMTELTI